MHEINQVALYHERHDSTQQSTRIQETHSRSDFSNCTLSTRSYVRRKQSTH